MFHLFLQDAGGFHGDRADAGICGLLQLFDLLDAAVLDLLAAATGAGSVAFDSSAE